MHFSLDCRFSFNVFMLFQLYWPGRMLETIELDRSNNGPIEILTNEYACHDEMIMNRPNKRGNIYSKVVEASVSGQINDALDRKSKNVGRQVTNTEYRRAKACLMVVPHDTCSTLVHHSLTPCR